MRRRLTALFFFTLAAGLQPSCLARPLCRVHLSAPLPSPQSPLAQQVPASTWAAVLLRGSGQDCAGRPLPKTETEAKRGKPLAQPHVRVWPVDESRYLVWLQTHARGLDTLAGPLALVRVAGYQAHVEALGALTLPAGAVTVAIKQLAGQPLVVVEHQLRNRRQLHLFVQADGRLLPPPGPAIDLLRQERAGRARGRPLVWKLCTTVAYGAEALTLTDHLEVIESGLHQTPRLLRQVEVQRSLCYRDQTWQLSAPATWEQMRHQG